MCSDRSHTVAGSGDRPVNSLVAQNRRRDDSSSAWQRSFCCRDMRPLIICRGPIRMEVMDIFEEMGIEGYGILLSEKDSIVYDHATAPELRKLRDQNRIHRVADYGGADGEERRRRIAEILAIAAQFHYDSIFAGYGFMAEDHEMISAVENSGLRFIGPCSRVAQRAGFKDQAKRTALATAVSVTPGVDNVAALTLLGKYPDTEALRSLLRSKKLKLKAAVLKDAAAAPQELAEHVLQAAQAQGVELFTIAELGAEVEGQIKKLRSRYPGQGIRLKAVGGGGGKGQRVLAPDAEASSATELIHEILGEVKSTSARDNRNILIELNIEQTRHQEIQLLGNGEWCISLGGRDCSAQMHEQKLLELSLTAEGLEHEIEMAEAAGVESKAESLRRQQRILREMEEQGVRFGLEVGLDSVSTFECIVGREEHFFMEVNTRIQVEHRVSELCCALRFCNPEAPQDSFIVNSLVEAMVLLARHGARLPKAQKVPRKMAATEVRLNASNHALAPHAGGMVCHWSPPLAEEIRDDQGISLPNPDTGSFMRYRLAGAYDSNIALLLSTGTDRRDSLQKMAEILRRTELEGQDLATNLHFHRGLLHWLLSEDPYAEIDTRFVQCYLAAVGCLSEQALKIDPEYAFSLCADHLSKSADSPQEHDALRDSLQKKRNLLLRPLRILIASPHLLAAWLACNKKAWEKQKSSWVYLKNPLQIIENSYYFLNMEFHSDKAAARCIWREDDQLLRSGLDFYRELERRTGVQDFCALQEMLRSETPPRGFRAALWGRVRAAHRGFQTGMELPLLLRRVSEDSGFDKFCVQADLGIAFPAQFRDAKLQEEMRRALAPPPPITGDLIPAPSGGMFYAREAPGMDPFVGVGEHVEPGSPLCIIEVMKMFNKVRAPFAGTVEEIFIPNDNMVVSKGESLFRIRPDREYSPPDVAEQTRLRARYTEQCMKHIG